MSRCRPRPARPDGVMFEHTPAEARRQGRGLAMTETDSLISRYPIEPYRGGHKKLEGIAVAFAGSPRGRGDTDKVLLLADPLSHQSFFYEFRAVDVVYVEEAPNLSLPDGSTISMVRIWVKKGSIALKIEPFSIQDTSQSLRDFF